MKSPHSKGFTLIEIVIALAIMSMVMVTASRFLISVLNQYSKDNYDIKLQTEVEEILNLVENKVMGADGAQVTSDQELQIYFSSASENYLFYLNETDYYYAKDGNKSQRVYLGTHVSSVDYVVTETTVTVNLHMAYRGVTYDASRSILLRNSAVAGSTSSLLSQIGAYINAAKNVTVNADGSLSVSDENSKQQIIRLDQTAGSVKCGSTVLGTDVSALTFSMSEDKKSVHVVVKTTDGQTLERDFEIGISVGETEESGADTGTDVDSTDTSETEQSAEATESTSGTQGGAVVIPGQTESSNTESGSASGENTNSSQETTSPETNGQDQPAAPEVISLEVDQNTAYINEKTFNVSMTVNNTGDALLWKDVKLRYYFIHPEAQTVVLDSLGNELNQLGATATFVTLDQDYVGATNYVELTFSSETVFAANSSQTLNFSLKYSSGQDITVDHIDYDMTQSYSSLSADSVLLFYQGEKIFGTAPETPMTKGEFFPVVTGYSVQDYGNNYTIEIKVKNKGASVSWKDVSLRLYYSKPDRETLSVDSTSISTTRNVQAYMTWSSTNLSSERYKDATGYLTIGSSNSDKFIQGEEATFKFRVYYSSWSNMSNSDSQNSFSNSHFLKDAVNVVVYQDTTKKCGSEPADIANNTVALEACKPVVVSRADAYSGDKKTYSFVTNLQNQGQTLDLSKLELRMYYISPGRKTVQLNSYSAKLTDYNNGGLSITASLKNTERSYSDAEHYVSVKLGGQDGKLYPYETLQASVTLQYSDWTVMAGGSASNKFDNSFSLNTGTTYIAVYYDGKLVSGSEPATQSTLKDCAPVVTVNEKLDSSTSTQANIHLEIQNTGKDLDYSKLELRYYYTIPGREKLQISDVSVSVDGQTMWDKVSYETKTLSTAMSGATGYISFKFKNEPTFYTYETLSISFTARYETGREMFSSQFRLGFQNSYSLGSGVEKVTVYYNSSCVFGSVPTAEAEKLTEQIEITDFTAKLSDDKLSYKVSFTLVNKGKDVSLSSLNTYFYYIKPSNTSLEILNLYNTFYGTESDQYNGLQLKSLADSALETQYQDATRRVTLGFGSSDTFYCDEQMQVRFELKLKKNNAYVAVNDTTETYGFGKSHSLKQGSFCEVAYSGKTLYGYAPTEVLVEDTTASTGPLPNITTVTLYSPNSGESWNTGWADDNNSGYWYSFYLYCTNIDEIDPQEIQVCLYLYYGNKEGSTNYFYYNGESGFSSMTYNALSTLKGSSNWKITFSGLYFNNGGCTIQSNIRKQTSYKLVGEADLSKCYSVSGDTIEIYYKGQLVWPKS
jgi:prepilin-type N-terminal cleavage/methylation domain-containing protein